MASSRLTQALSDTLLAWFPLLVAGLVMPLNIYTANQIDFDYNPSILLPFFLTSAFAFAGTFALCHWAPSRASKTAHRLFFLGIFFMASDVMVPLQWGLMDGAANLGESWNSIAIQSGLAIALIVCCMRLPDSWVKDFGPPYVVVLLLWQLSTLVQIATSQRDDLSISEAPPESNASAPQIRRLPNIYQIVFDGYSSVRFMKSAQDTKLAEELVGFTFFQNNMANFTSTDASVPSYITGKVFKGGSFKDFQLDAKKGGVRKSLQDQGYEISIYAPNRSRFWMYGETDHVYTTEDLVIGAGLRQRLAQVTFVRVAPEPFRKEALVLANLILFGQQSDYKYYKRLSIPLMEQFLADETERPSSGQYVYLHLILPHEPYVWDAACRPGGETDFGQQTNCAGILMKEFVTKLKALGRYRDSMIVLQSDHGKGVVNKVVFKSPPDEVREKVAAKQTWYEVDEFFGRLHALLLVKPPNSEEAPLRVSQQVSQLADVPATLFRAVGLPSVPSDGHSVFALDEVAERDVSVFAGVVNKSVIGKRIRLGHGISRTSLGHIGYNVDRGWRNHPDLEATHEGW